MQTHGVTIQVTCKCVSFHGSHCTDQGAVQVEVQDVQLSFNGSISLPAPAEAISVGVKLAWSVLNLKIVVGEEKGPPGELRIFSLSGMEMLQSSVIGHHNKLCSSQVSVELRDCKD